MHERVPWMRHFQRAALIRHAHYLTATVNFIQGWSNIVPVNLHFTYLQTISIVKKDRVFDSQQVAFCKHVILKVLLDRRTHLYEYMIYRTNNRIFYLLTLEQGNLGQSWSELTKRIATYYLFNFIKFDKNSRVKNWSNMCRYIGQRKTFLMHRVV